ncbi:MAG: flagellar hook-associated protein FlgL [Deltaproteobacteria bacterium]|nr:flagellar hook-associated protein FlgL [Deltaproteobacteria bacterium]
MRVTDRMVFETGAARVLGAQSRLARASEELSTGRKVIHAGDAPAAAGLILTGRAELQRLQSLSDASATAADELDAADAALGSMTDVITRARELAVQLANGTYSAADRGASAPEVRSLRDGLLALGNREFGGRYLFGGRADQAAPFDAAAAYVGDAGTRQVEIAPGTWADASVRADQALKGGATGVDVFAALDDLQTALTNNDAVAITAAIPRLDQALRQVIDARTRAGAQSALFTLSASMSAQARTNQEIAVGRLSDADTVQSASRLALAQRALEASIAAAQKSFQASLLDVLK